MAVLSTVHGWLRPTTKRIAGELLIAPNLMPPATSAVRRSRPFGHSAYLPADVTSWAI